MPFLSIVRRPALVRRRLTQRFSLSTQNRRYCRLGRKRRLRLVVGVGNVVAHHRGLAGDLTDSSHGSLLRIRDAALCEAGRAFCDRDYSRNRSRNQARGPATRSPGQSRPRSANDVSRPPATTKWSSVRMSTSDSACLSAWVRSSSARLGSATPRRVVVGEDHRRGVAGERRLDDLARIDAGLRQRAAEELLGGEQPVLAVEEEPDEDLVGPRREREAQVVAHRLRRRAARRARQRPRSTTGGRARPSPRAAPTWPGRPRARCRLRPPARRAGRSATPKRASSARATSSALRPRHAGAQQQRQRARRPTARRRRARAGARAAGRRRSVRQPASPPRRARRARPGERRCAARGQCKLRTQKPNHPPTGR